jgi:hypothetical protein
MGKIVALDKHGKVVITLDGYGSSHFYKTTSELTHIVKECAEEFCVEDRVFYGNYMGKIVALDKHGKVVITLDGYGSSHYYITTSELTHIVEECAEEFCVEDRIYFGNDKGTIVALDDFGKVVITLDGYGSAHYYKTTNDIKIIEDSLGEE